MAKAAERPALATVANGVVGPLYFDRQIVRAEDLTLDRTSHDHELARMRRLLHGWGVVAGLIPIVAGGSLRISAGYGITRTGAEVFLAEAVEIADIVRRIWACCGPEAPGCDVLDEDERRRRDDDREATMVTSWLVARPTRSPAEPRAGIPEGCAHPANTLWPTRACHGVSIELLCALPPELAVPDTGCADLVPLFCATPPALLPLPPLPEEVPDVLVLGRLVAGPDTAMFAPAERRTVLPVAVLQDWLRACLCRLLAARPDRPEEEEPDVEPDRPRPERFDWRRLLQVLEANGFTRAPQPRRPLPEVPRRPTVPRLLVEPETLRRLGEAGITGPEAFLAADPAGLAERLALPQAEVEALARELESLRPFFAGPRL